MFLHPSRIGNKDLGRSVDTELMMPRKIFLLSIVAATVLFLSAWGQAAEPELPASAERFTKSFFELLDQGRSKEAFLLAAPVAGRSQNEFINMLSEREDMGEARSRRLAKVETIEHFADLPHGQYLLIEYETTFAVQPHSREILVLDRNDTGAYGLAEYKIQYNRWPQAIRIIANGLFIVFFIMALLSVITWLIGRVVRVVEKKSNVNEKG